MATIASEAVSSNADDAVSRSPLTPALLERCRKRAAGYDRDNKFFSEDFEELRDAGYLRLPLPAEFGGPGGPVSEYARRPAPQGLDSHGRPAPAAPQGGGEDHLDIPAFLRRQAN